jgi:hypothetical protein
MITYILAMSKNYYGRGMLECILATISSPYHLDFFFSKIKNKKEKEAKREEMGRRW